MHDDEHLFFASRTSVFAVVLLAFVSVLACQPQPEGLVVASDARLIVVGELGTPPYPNVLGEVFGGTNTDVVALFTRLSTPGQRASFSVDAEGRLVVAVVASTATRQMLSAGQSVADGAVILKHGASEFVARAIDGNVVLTPVVGRDIAGALGALALALHAPRQPQPAADTVAVIGKDATGARFDLSLRRLDATHLDVHGDVDNTHAFAAPFRDEAPAFACSFLHDALAILTVPAEQAPSGAGDAFTGGVVVALLPPHQRVPLTAADPLSTVGLALLGRPRDASAAESLFATAVQQAGPAGQVTSTAGAKAVFLTGPRPLSVVVRPDAFVALSGVDADLQPQPCTGTTPSVFIDGERLSSTLLPAAVLSELQQQLGGAEPGAVQSVRSALAHVHTLTLRRENTTDGRVGVEGTLVLQPVHNPSTGTRDLR